MGEILTYSPSDLLMFPPEAYWALFERANALAWPAALPLSILLAVAWALSVDGRPVAGRLAGVVLGLAWGVVALAFVRDGYAELNWAAVWLLPLFGAQAVLSIVLGAMGRLAPSPGGRSGLTTSVLVLAALLVWPFLAPALGRGFESAQVFAVSPDPTAVATLGFVAVADRRWVRWALGVVPMAWFAVSGATLVTMGAPQAVATVAAIATGGLALSLRTREPGGRAEGPA